MKPDENQVRSVVRGVWETQLGLILEDFDGVTVTDDAATITAAVHIAGAFSGGIRIRCSRALIRRAATIMFELPTEQLTNDDERDVVGELTNVVAGNIKALIPGDNSLSLPTIIQGSDYLVSSLDVKTSNDYGFALDGEAMVVTVVEHGDG